MTVALIGFAAVLILAFMRMPLGIALGVVGVIGFGELSGYRAAISNAARLVIDSGQSYGLSVLPMFILMGLLVEKGGMAKELYRAAYVFLGHKKGGLSMSTIVSCGMFSAICGPSLATAATMAIRPDMRWIELIRPSIFLFSFLTLLYSAVTSAAASAASSASLTLSCTITRSALMRVSPCLLVHFGFEPVHVAHSLHISCQ